MENKLRVWWIPQVPMKAFYVEVSNLAEANLLIETLAQYDDFQFKNKIKPDYSNVGGLQRWDEDNQEWEDWYNEETGEDFDEWRSENLPKIIFPKK